jgi:type VI secretion system protein VasD
MTLPAIRRSSVLLAAAIVLMAGCKSGPPKPAQVRLTIQASKDVNPDESKRPSPVIVRVFQLKVSDAFKAADFFPLYDDDQKLLAQDLIKREEFQVRPGETLAVPLSVAGEAKFVGVLVAFRDYRSAQWRTVVAAPLKKNALILVSTNRVDLSSR